MAKKEEKIMENIITPIVEVITKFGDKAMEMEEKKMEDKENWDEQKEMVKAEYARIVELMKKSEPGSEKYEKLARALYSVKNVMTGWY